MCLSLPVPFGASVPQPLAWYPLFPFKGPCIPDCFFLFPQRQGAGMYLNMSWNEFFKKTGIR